MKNIQAKTGCDCHGTCYRKIYISKDLRMCVQYVTSREPAQQACDHMLIIANFIYLFTNLMYTITIFNVLLVGLSYRQCTVRINTHKLIFILLV